MRTVVFVNPSFSYFRDFVELIANDFNSLGTEIHHGRNEVRKVTVNGLPITIKYFKKITLANRIIFATIRKSKAQRSFEHSRYLIRNGITTPEPIAWINCYRKGLLYKSFYVSYFSDYKPFAELIKLPTVESQSALKSFARFVFKLHRMGILHNDFTVNNVLWNVFDNEYDFSLIDINRMRFCGDSVKRGARNLERLKIPIDKMAIIAAEYAYQANISDLKMLNAMTFYRIRYLMKISIKKWIKSMLNVSYRKDVKHILTG